MTLILSGTNGVSDIDGDASTPALRGTDANSGVFFGSDVVGVSTGGSEKVSVGASALVINDGGADFDFRVEGDTNANLLFVDASTDAIGIGTNTTTDAGVTITRSITRDSGWDAKLALQSTGSDDYPALLFSGCSATDRYGAIVSTTSTSGNVSNKISSAITFPLTSATAGNIAFRTNGNIGTSTETERMRIDSSGKTGIGFSAPNARLVVGGTGSDGSVSGARNVLQLRNSNASGNQSNFFVFGSPTNETYCFIGNDINADGTTVNQLNIQAGATGGVYLANGGTSWTAVSDERIKDIIEPIENAADKVATLRTVIGKYKTDAEDVRRVFLIAQDVQAVLPEAVTVGTDEINTLGLSYADTIPLLVAAIKELKAELDTVKAELATLKGN